MRQLLIADDNSVIRKGIINLLDQYRITFDNIYECANGKEALDVLCTHGIDLVITDIRMPAMDGIQLIQEAKKISHKAKFIVLTMYEDFNYAKDSINYGAKAYLVKPISGLIFYETMHRVMKEINQVEELMNQHRVDALKLIFLSYEHYKKDIRHKLKSIGFTFYDKPFYIGVLMEIDQDMKDCHHEKDFSQAEYRIHQLCREENLDIFYFILNNEIVLFSGTQQALLSVLHHLSLYTTCFMSISAMCTESADIYNYYSGARDGLKYRYLDDKRYINSDDIRCLRRMDRLPADHLARLEALMGTNHMKEIDEILGEILSKEVIITYQISYLEAVIENIYFILEKVTRALPQKSEDIMKKLKMLKSLYHFVDVKSYISHVREYIYHINQSFTILKQLYKNKEIDTAIHFVQENYYKDITLAVVSNHVSLNYSYFSHAFKETTGISFSEYLREVRINKSIDFLGTKDLKIGEIATKVGFNTPKHYTRSFKAVMGISPLQYRERLLTSRLVNETTKDTAL